MAEVELGYNARLELETGIIAVAAEYEGKNVGGGSDFETRDLDFEFPTTRYANEFMSVVRERFDLKYCQLRRE